MGLRASAGSCRRGSSGSDDPTRVREAGEDPCGVVLGKDADPCDYCNLYASTQPNALQTGGVVAYGVTHYRSEDCDASGCYWWYKNERWYNVNKTYYFQVKCRNCYIAPWLDSRNEVSEYLPY